MNNFYSENSLNVLIFLLFLGCWAYYCITVTVKSDSATFASEMLNLHNEVYTKDVHT